MLGILAQTLTPELARKLGVSHAGGVLVVEVNPGMPAQQAGIKPGDIIINYNGHPIRTMMQLLELMLRANL